MRKTQKKKTIDWQRLASDLTEDMHENHFSTHWGWERFDEGFLYFNNHPNQSRDELLASIRAWLKEQPELAEEAFAGHGDEGEEMDPADPHIEILLRFGEAMGLDPAQVRQSKPLPTTQALLDWIFILSRHRSMVEVIAGAQIGLESQPPELYGDIVPALKEKYGCTEAQMKYFPTHVEADTEHGGRAYALVEKYARSEDQRRRAVLAAREGAEKRWLYIDGIYIHYVLGYKLTDARWDEYQADYGPSPFYRGVR